MYDATISSIPIAPPSKPADFDLGRAALRKVTVHLIPLMAIGYGTAYMDRVNISFAALQMNRALHFSSAAYGLGAGLFFLSYALGEIPSNLLLCRFGARRWLSRIMLTWGIIATGMLFVRTPMQFYVMRVLLGAAEAGFFPGVVFYLMQWFPPEMRARAIARFYISLPLSSVLMGSVAGALLKLDGRLGLAGWQWLFLIEGLPALVLSVVFFVVLPDGPADARWLTADERDWILACTRPVGSAHHGYSIVSALRDARTILLGAFMLCFTAAGYAYMLYGPSLVQETAHYSAMHIGFLIAWFNLVGAGAMLLNATHSDRSGERYWHILPLCLIMAAALFFCGLSRLPLVVISSLGVLMVANSALQGPVWSLPASFLHGRSAAAGIAAINSVSILGGFIGPYWMGVARDLTGNYQRGLITMAIPMLIATSIILVLRGIQAHDLANHTGRLR
ncbi:MAG TPA: MFS transporter [Acidobacteriaceae bacterium]|nr:MFS transporter [Acidobacteriaceae bacterium]